MPPPARRRSCRGSHRRSAPSRCSGARPCGACRAGRRRRHARSVTAARGVGGGSSVGRPSRALLSSGPGPVPLVTARSPSWSTILDAPPPHEAAATAARPARLDPVDPRCGVPPRAGPHRPGEGRGHRDRGRGHEGRGLRRRRDRGRHLRGHPGRHRDVAVPRGVAPRLDRLGRPARGPAVRRDRRRLRARGGRRERGRIGRAFLVGLLLAVVVGVLMAFGLPNQAYTAVGEQRCRGSSPGVRPLVVGMVIVGAIGLLVGIVAAARGGGFGARASPGSWPAWSSAPSRRRRRATRSVPASASPSATSRGSR